MSIKFQFYSSLENLKVTNSRFYKVNRRVNLDIRLCPHILDCLEARSSTTELCFTSCLLCLQLSVPILLSYICLLIRVLKGLCITPPEMWISHGGQITFPLLGSSTTWTVSTMLKIFMDRLHKMPWGLAVQNRLVLNKLLEAEGAVD